ncbi:MAG: hypothetical protein QOD53_722 [Thermoleophilaceae bacterium]|nr:hypothetical protein [Thermoleophilaceae bacterium]
MAGQRLTSRVTGPLGEFAGGYDAWLERRGICRRAIRDRLWQFWYLSEWLDGRGLSPSDLDRRRAEQHLAERRVAGCVEWVTRFGLRLPLEYLREIGVVPSETEVPEGPVDLLVGDYPQVPVARTAVRGNDGHRVRARRTRVLGRSRAAAWRTSGGQHGVGIETVVVDPRTIALADHRNGRRERSEVACSSRCSS